MAIKILLVDDSATVRLILTSVIAADPAFEVVGYAVNGREAVDKVRTLHPDVVLLDVNMPVMDGLTALSEIRSVAPDTLVIMFSALTEAGAKATFDALARGAQDYVAKPAGGARETVLTVVREQLSPRIKALVEAKERRLQVTRLPLVTPLSGAAGGPRAARIVVIAASTGGPPVLTAIMSQLPADFPVPVLVVQHMPAPFVREFVQRLNGRCALRVSEAQEHAPIERGRIWVARGDYHMECRSRNNALRLHLHQRLESSGLRPAADPLFRSAARLFQAQTLAVVLTGMGTDGLGGCRDIHAAGGQVLVQDQRSSVIWGMPGAVAEAGLADAVLPLERIVAEIGKRVRGGGRERQRDLRR